MGKWVKTIRRAKRGVFSSLDHAENKNTSRYEAWTLGGKRIFSHVPSLTPRLSLCEYNLQSRETGNFYRDFMRDIYGLMAYEG